MKRLSGWIVLVAVTAQPLSRLAAQQVAPNRATAYLHPTDVRDARALWVNPAGLGVLREASVYAEVAVGDPGARGRLRQVNAGFNARGLALGYQRDILDAGGRGHTYRLGLAGGASEFAAGVAIAYYRGDGTNGTGWDLGASYGWLGGALTVGGVIRNIGQPVVRGLRQRLTFVPGATWHPAAVAAGVSLHARVTPDSVAAYAFGLSWRTGTGPSRWPLEIIARLDTDGGLRRGAFAFGLSIGNQDRVGTVVSTPGDASSIDGISLYGLATREPRKRR